jgi:RimJ/RimL family protein N-acetyltransferase
MSSGEAVGEQGLDHDIHARGHVFALRPVRISDAALIVELRADLERARFLNEITLTLAAQQAYLAEYLKRAGDYYFVIEERGSRRPEGLIALYNINATARSAEVGRWILRPRSVAAVESLLVLYRVAFDKLGMDSVLSLTIAENKHSLSFLDSCGLQRGGVRLRDVKIGGRWRDRIEHVLTRAHWPTLRARLDRLARGVRLIEEGTPVGD